jgi:hypothetical protein
MNSKNLARLAVFAVAAAVLALVTAGCTSKSGGSASGAASSAEGKASAVVGSITANPTTAADLAKAKALVRHCFAGTPLQQAHQIHVVFLSSAAGKNGPAVVAARNTTATCLGLSKADEKPFFNDAVTAAEAVTFHKLATSHDARVTYVSVTLPGLLLKYSSAGYVPPASPGAGTVPGTTPSPAVTTGSAA